MISLPGWRKGAGGLLGNCDRKWLAKKPWGVREISVAKAAGTRGHSCSITRTTIGSQRRPGRCSDLLLSNRPMVKEPQNCMSHTLQTVPSQSPNSPLYFTCKLISLDNGKHADPDNFSKK